LRDRDEEKKANENLTKHITLVIIMGSRNTHLECFRQLDKKVNIKSDNSDATSYTEIVSFIMNNE